MFKLSNTDKCLISYHLFTVNTPGIIIQTGLIMLMVAVIIKTMITVIIIIILFPGTPSLLDKRRGGIPLPGISSARDDQGYRWSPRYEEQLNKWQDRSSPCERPRTYDRFYQKLPGNFQEPLTDSAISVCSSEENEKIVNSDKKKRKTKKSERQSRKELHYSRTLTEHDVRHLERHLSMKRTIRKKIMRDLQQAFVQDPREFTKVTRKRDINMKSLNFDRKNGTGQSEPNFLDMLRDSDDSGNGSPTR